MRRKCQNRANQVTFYNLYDAFSCIEAGCTCKGNFGVSIFNEEITGVFLITWIRRGEYRMLEIRACMVIIIMMLGLIRKIRALLSSSAEWKYCYSFSPLDQRCCQLWTFAGSGSLHRSEGSAHLSTVWKTRSPISGRARMASRPKQSICIQTIFQTQARVFVFCIYQ